MKTNFQFATIGLLGASTVLTMFSGAAQAKPSVAKPTMAHPITLVGIVVGTPSGREITLRANGATHRVRPLAKVDISSIRGGDQVRAFGRPSGLFLNYANVRVTVPRASNEPTDYNPAPNTTIIKTDKRP